MICTSGEMHKYLQVLGYNVNNFKTLYKRVSLCIVLCELYKYRLCFLVALDKGGDSKFDSQKNEVVGVLLIEIDARSNLWIMECIISIAFLGIMRASLWARLFVREMLSVSPEPPMQLLPVRLLNSLLSSCRSSW